MDIRITKSQKILSQEARRFLSKECSSDFIRELYENKRADTETFWRKIAEMDWMAMNIPEVYEGLGLELTDVCLILEEMGRALVPWQFFSTVMLASQIIILGGNESQKQTYLPKIAKGEIKGTLAIFESDGNVIPGRIKTQISRKKDHFVVNGSKLFVTDADTADFIITVVTETSNSSEQNAVSLVIIDTKSEGVEIQPLVTMDGSRKLFEVIYNETFVSEKAFIGLPGEGKNIFHQAMNRVLVGLAAENVGGAQKAMEIAVDHAKKREQFGKPLGSFQAIKHVCADMEVAVEGARSILYYAAWACEHDLSQSETAALVAKVHSANAFKDLTASATQVLGAMGITWECDMHLYYKRAKANEVIFGNNSYHTMKLADLLI